MKVNYVDALAGTGKTTSAIQYAIEQAQNGAKIAIVQPSKDLINQTYDNIVAKNPGVVVNRFHGESVQYSVKNHVMEYLNETCQGTGEIMLITHQAFLSLKYWHNPDIWDVIIDEIPQIHTEWSKRLDVNFKTLTDYINVGEVIGDKYAKITVKNGSDAVIRRMAECQYGDEQDRLFQDVAARLNNQTMWETVAYLESLEQIMAGEGRGEHKLQTYSLLQPEYFECFRSFTVMGAMFTKSVMYLIWRNKVEFVEHTKIASNLAEVSHKNGKLLTIKYLYERNWSKAFREQIAEGKTVLNHVKETVLSLMKQQDFIYATNNDDRTGLRRGIRLSNVSHGINEYHTFDNAVFLSALNSNGPAFSFMQANDITSAELTEAQFFQTMYQFVMRCSLRNPDDKSFKTIVVMDKRSADFLASYFPGCTVASVEGMKAPEPKKRGRPATGKAMTTAERVAKSRAKKKTEQTQQP